MDVHMDKKPNGVVKSNGASHDNVYVAPKISEDLIEAKDYDVKECTAENSVDGCCDKQDVVVVKSKNFDTDGAEDRNESHGSQKSSFPTPKPHGPAHVRTNKTVSQPFALATEKRASGINRRFGSETVADVNNVQTPMPKKMLQVMETQIGVF